MSTLFKEQDLREAQVTFSLAGQLIYLEPEYNQISEMVQNDIFKAAPFGMEDPLVNEGLSLLQSWSQSVLKNGLKEEVTNLRSEWLMVLAGAGEPKAPCWEAYYRETNSPLFGKTALAVRSWYKEYGLMVENQNKEPDDHLGLMLGFIGYLIGQEADAVVIHNKEEASRFLQAQKSFMVDHVLPWLPAWYYQLSKYAQSDFYRGVASMTFGLCRMYAERFSIAYDSKDQKFCYQGEMLEGAVL